MNKHLKYPVLVLLLLFVAGALICNIALLAMGSALGSWTVMHNATWLRIAQTITVAVSFIVPALFVMRRQGYKIEMLPKREHHWQDYALAVIAWLAAAPLVNLTSQWNHKLTAFDFFKHIETLQQSIAKTTETLVAYDSFGELCIVFLVAALLAAMAEELFFRGAMQNSLLERIKPAWTIVIVAVVFSLMHGDVLDFVPRVLLGLVFGYVAWKTGTLAITILLHTLNNTIAIIGTNNSISELELIGTGDTWFLSVAGAAILIWALSKIKAHRKETDNNNLQL